MKSMHIHMHACMRTLTGTVVCMLGSILHHSFATVLKIVQANAGVSVADAAGAPTFVLDRLIHRSVCHRLVRLVNRKLPDRDYARMMCQLRH